MTEKHISTNIHGSLNDLNVSHLLWGIHFLEKQQSINREHSKLINGQRKYALIVALK